MAINWLEEINELIGNPTVTSIEALREKVVIKNKDTYAKHSISKYAARMFLTFGVAGVRELRELFDVADSPLTAGDILLTLLKASQKSYVKPLFVGESAPQKYPTITEEMAKEANHALQDIFAQSLIDYKTFSYILNFLYMQNINPLQEVLVQDVFKLLRDSTIKINDKIITDYQFLIDRNGTKEELFQKYLSEHPILIDPLAMEIIPKQLLGKDYITDFVVRKYNDQYILVEIEKPDTPIFTRNNDFTSHFSHALGQVLDFQEWVESNIAYAQKLMPNIVSPLGLLVIGRSSDLTERQIGKLKRFNINNQSKLRVATFDSLLVDSKRLHKNLTSG